MTTPSTPPNNEKAQNVIIGIGLFLVALFLFFVVFKDDPKEKAITTNYEESNYDTSSPATSVTEPASESYSSTSIPDEDPYYIMSVAFEGNPEENSIKLLVEEVLERHGFENTKENALKVGNMLVSLRKASKVGVTEMEILKHMYQKGSAQRTLPDQAAMSSTILETTK